MLRRHRMMLALAVSLPGCTDRGVTADGDDAGTVGEDDTAGTEASESGGASADTSSGAGATCGDGQVDPGEACDDSNLVDGDGCNHDCVVSGTSLWSIETKYHNCDRFRMTTDAAGAIYVGAYRYGDEIADLSRIDADDGQVVWNVDDVPANMTNGQHLAVLGWRAAEGVLVAAQVAVDAEAGGALFQERDADGEVVDEYLVEQAPTSLDFGAISLDAEDGIWSAIDVAQTEVELRRFVSGGDMDWSVALGPLGKSPSFQRSAGTPTAGAVFMGTTTTDLVAAYGPDVPGWSVELPDTFGASDVDVGADGTVHVAVTEFFGENDSRVYVLRYTPDGAPAGMIIHEYATEADVGDGWGKIGVDESGAVVVVADETVADLDPYWIRARIAKYNVAGEMLWTHLFEPSEGLGAAARTCDVVVRPDGSVLFAMELEPESGDASISIHKFAP